MCVCLSVCDHIFGSTRLIFANFLCMLHMAVARSSSGSVVICYVLPVLWTTSYLLISQGCSTSPPSWSAVHMQPWAWLYTVCSNTSCMPTDAWDYFSGVLTVTSQVATPGVESAVCLVTTVLITVVSGLDQCSLDSGGKNSWPCKQVSVLEQHVRGQSQGQCRSRSVGWVWLALGFGYCLITVIIRYP